MNIIITKERADKLLSRCSECGMLVGQNDYHPYAACLMYRACRNATTVERNLKAVVEHGRQIHLKEMHNVKEDNEI